MNTVEDLNQVLEDLAVKLHGKFDPTSWGDCNEINANAAYILKNFYEQDVQLVSGHVELDNPMDPEDDEDEHGVYDPRHMWIQVAGMVLDFASLQFKDHIDEMPSHNYFIGEMDNYKASNEISIDNEFVDKEFIAQVSSH